MFHKKEYNRPSPIKTIKKINSYYDLLYMGHALFSSLEISNYLIQEKWSLNE